MRHCRLRIGPRRLFMMAAQPGMNEIIDVADPNDIRNFWLVHEQWHRAPPKYVRNPYIYFCQANYGRFARVLNTRMPQCILRAMGQAWRTMDLNEKKPYVELSNADRERYVNAKNAWKASYRGRPPKYRKRNKYATTWLPFTPPKRYRTAFIWFHADVRRQMQEKFPNWDGPEIVQEIGSRWKAMSDEEKEPYKLKANEDMERYMSEMRFFRREVFRQEANARIRNLQVRLSATRNRHVTRHQQAQATV